MGVVFVFVFVVRCGFDLIVFVVGRGGRVIGDGRKGENTESRWFADERWGGGAGVGWIGGGLGFGAAGVAGLALGEGKGGGEEEVEEEEG